MIVNLVQWRQFIIADIKIKVILYIYVCVHHVCVHHVCVYMWPKSRLVIHKINDYLTMLMTFVLITYDISVQMRSLSHTYYIYIYSVVI